MENLIQMSQEIKEFATAFCAFQSEVSNPKTTEDNPFFNSKYSDLANVLRTIKEPLVKNGLSILQGATTEERMVGASNEIQAIVCIETILLHLSGQYARYTLRIVADRFAQGKPVPLTAQGIGSAITYGRRYAVNAILGVAQEDDDGNESAGHTDRGRPAKPQEQQRPQPKNEPLPALSGEQVIAAFEAFSKDPKADKAAVIAYLKKRNDLIGKLPDDQKLAIRTAYDILIKKLESAGETKPPSGETKPPSGETKPPSGETKPKADETPEENKSGDWAASMKITNEAIMLISSAKTVKEVQAIYDTAKPKVQDSHMKILQGAVKGRVETIKTKKEAK